MTAALDFATCRSTPSISGSPSSLVAKIAAGSALIRSPISRSEALIGVPTTSRTTRSPLVQSVCSRPAPGMPLSFTWLGVGPRSRSMMTAGASSTVTAPSSELRTIGRRPIPDSSIPADTAASVS